MGRYLGDRVPNFITHNEPNVVALLGHGWGWHAPGMQSADAVMAVTHHLNLAHGLAVSRLRNKVPEAKIGTIITMQPVVGWENDPDSSARLDALSNRAFTDPALLGTYPELLIDELSPFIQQGDLELIHQPLDFFGLNHYTTMRACSAPDDALGVEIIQPPPEIPQTIKGWEINPEMFYQQLLELKDRYGNLPVYITENGCAAPDKLGSDGKVSDPERVAYFRDYLSAASRAIEDGVNLKGYFAWSLLDNFEWADGYTQRFGIVYVDYPTQKRIPKDSFYFLKNIFQNNKVD
jgi:beta-glucosidase